MVGGRRIIDRVADALRAAVSELLLVSNSPGAAEWLPDVPTLADVRQERGSMVALHTALTCAGGPVVVVAWDMPFIDPGLLTHIVHRARGAPYAVIPEGPSGLEPFCAVYQPACLPLLEAALDAGDFRLRAFLRALPAATVMPLSEISPFGDPRRLFFNVNTPLDLDIAERLASSA
jgi:molybdenum cofactor guanylyltransferase